jgi:LSD1 subclass zinc finger protein
MGEAGVAPGGEDEVEEIDCPGCRRFLSFVTAQYSRGQVIIFGTEQTTQHTG